MRFVHPILIFGKDDFSTFLAGTMIGMIHLVRQTVTDLDRVIDRDNERDSDSGRDSGSGSDRDIDSDRYSDK